MFSDAKELFPNRHPWYKTLDQEYLSTKAELSIWACAEFLCTY
jgi:hypothetical protein